MTEQQLRKPNWFDRFSIKTIAILMLCVLGASILIGGFLNIEMVQYGIFEGYDSFYKSDECYNLSSYAASNYLGRVHNKLIDSRNVTDPNMSIIIYEVNNGVSTEIFSHSSGAEKTGFHNTYYFSIMTESSEVPGDYLINEYSVYHADTTADHYYRVDVSLADPLVYDADNEGVYDQANLYSSYNRFNFLYANRNAIVTVTIILVILFVLDFIWILYSSGYDVGYEGIRLNFTDQLPLEVLTLVVVGYEIVFIVVIQELASFLKQLNYLNLVIIFAGLIFMGLGILLWITSVTRRIKAKVFMKNTLLYMISHFIYIFIMNISLVWRVALVYGALMIANAYLIYERLIVFAMIIDIIFGLYLLWWCINASKIKKEAALMAAGNMENRIDTELMPADLKNHAQALNSLQEGTNIAVEKQLQSERLKTELITNVSHDIKTPLTSIINYVDLLQKDPDSPQKQQYLEVLDRQSKRLKKMTEDLIEASKASTGNISVQLTDINVREIIEQSLAEYQEKFEKAKLTVELEDGEQMVVRADGTLLWRILSNLYSNITKYALENTRVYIDVSRVERYCCITVKNISRDRLNISSDELMERFVRGDRSRHTEGSGLGLNISKSLAELMDGQLQLIIDGDLFKVELLLPEVK